MSPQCTHDVFVSPILVDDVESESIVQGGEIEQPLGQGGVPENLDAESDSSSDEDNNEAIPVNAAPRPNRPSKAEVDEHMLSHLPYRSWCAHCVKGKAKSKKHTCTSQNNDHEIPMVTLDYMFMGDDSSTDEEGSMPILVVKDVLSPGCGTGMVFAHVVPRKGANSYAIKILSKDIAILGHPELVLKSDSEPAIIALKEATKRERSERIVFESPPIKESQANGAIENAVQQVQGQFRAMKDALESRLGERINGN